MVVSLITVVLFFLLPVVIVAAQERVAVLRRVNPIIPAYVAGLALSFALPHTDAVTAIQDAVSSGMVALSIPLMLFAADVRRWARAGGEAIRSMLLAAVAVMTAVTAAHLLFRNGLSDSARIGGLLFGVYTGGTPNLAALRVALNVESSLYLTVHTVDLIVSAVYILVMLGLGRLLIGGSVATGDRSTTDFRRILARGNRRMSATALGAAVGVIVVSVGVSMLFPAEHRTVVTILSLTTVALAATLLPSVRGMDTTFAMGEFFILVFSVAVGSMADIAAMVAASPLVIAYTSVVVFGSLILHVVLARLFRVGMSTFLVTSVSAVCSPPFVGMLAPIVRDPQVIAAGITTGIIGYAVGNYLGVFAAWLLAFL